MGPWGKRVANLKTEVLAQQPTPSLDSEHTAPVAFSRFILLWKAQPGMPGGQSQSNVPGPLGARRGPGPHFLLSQLPQDPNRAESLSNGRPHPIPSRVRAPPLLDCRSRGARGSWGSYLPGGVPQPWAGSLPAHQEGQPDHHLQSCPWEGVGKGGREALL